MPVSGRYKDALVSMTWAICSVWMKVPLILSHILEFWRNICHHNSGIISQEVCGNFSRTMQDLILPNLQNNSVALLTEWVCLTDLSTVYFCLLSKNVWCIMKRINRKQQQPWTVKQMKSCSQQKLVQNSTIHKLIKKTIKGIIKGKGTLKKDTVNHFICRCI